jgi:hypothetical protein
MDYHLEQPSADLSVIDRQQNENNESSDDDDEGPDWANLPLATPTHVVLNIDPDESLQPGIILTHKARPTKTWGQGT